MDGQGQSLTAFIANEDALIKEAALALPHSFDKCTYELGPIRQNVHLCLTCGIPRGMCSACSVVCHGDHGVSNSTFPAIVLYRLQI